MSEEKQAREQTTSVNPESEIVSWWSWRPSLKPWRALALGGLLTLLALFLLANGLSLLVAGILDSVTSPLGIPGVVSGHSKNVTGSPQLTIHFHQTHFPSQIILAVSPAAASLADSTTVTVDYGPHLHLPYALVSGNHSYALPGTSPLGNLLETLALLAFGLILLPYPLLLAYWGWSDLRAEQMCQTTATVIALRAARQTTTRTPGLVPRSTGTWHGVALRIDHSANEPDKAAPLIFGIQQGLYQQLRPGYRVQVSYSPCLHHLYKLQHIEQT